jgi:hypothetical protein
MDVAKLELAVLALTQTKERRDRIDDRGDDAVVASINTRPSS